ncbi:MAG: type II toxin-antitoxin system HicB family antitoxin [Pseudomonadales bacterium]|jgi:antitoxin HicB|nr:type II toxin-antitoxin system HicB family antitoxin [Pseudomonadales bacterium]
MRNLNDYPFEIRPLTAEEGGGFLITYPDFNTCISDGETVEDAIANGQETLAGMIESLEAWGQPVPAPNSGGVASGKFVTRLPKSLHAALSARAKVEGVSLNTLVLSFMAEGMGAKRSEPHTR